MRFNRVPIPNPEDDCPCLPVLISRGVIAVGLIDPLPYMLDQLVRRIQDPQQEPSHLRRLDVIEASDRFVGPDLAMEVSSRLSELHHIRYCPQNFIFPTRPNTVNSPSVSTGRSTVSHFSKVLVRARYVNCGSLLHQLHG